MTVLISAKLRICGIARSLWEEILSSQTDTMLAAPHTIQDDWRTITMVWANLGLFEVIGSLMKRLKQVKYNQLCKRIWECESEYREIQEAHQKLIEEWKDMAVSANKRLWYLERGLVELERKFIQRIENCQNAEGNEGGHLARAYLLLGLRELVKLFDRAKDAESGEGPSGTK